MAPLWRSEMARVLNPSAMSERHRGVFTKRRYANPCLPLPTNNSNHVITCNWRWQRRTV